MLGVSIPPHLCMWTTCVPSTYGGHQGDRKALPMMTGVKGEGEQGPAEEELQKNNNNSVGLHQPLGRLQSLAEGA